MLDKLKPNNFRTYLASLEFKTKKLFKEMWPINWSSFKKPRLVLVSFVEAPYSLKTFFLVSTVAAMISIYFLFLGSYLVFTKEVADNGGEVREATDGIMKNFNPVLEPSSEAEKRVNALLYHPLYRVNVPDFLLNKDAEIGIQPVLINKAPEWQDLDQPQIENRYRVLRFELKNDIKWSDGTPITISDVEYSFERLKEPKSYTQFRDAFSKVEFAKVSERVFDLRSTVSNPQLIYLANFSPISQNFYENQSTERLLTSFNSAKPTVTSGYYTFTKAQVKDPDSTDNTLRDNPIRVDGQDGFATVVLTKNPVQNTNENTNIDKYIFKTYNDLFDSGGSDSSNVERAAKSGKVDIFTRTLGPGTTPFSSDLETRLGMAQKLINSNNYYNIFLNLKRNDLFINQPVRKYLICNLIKYKLNPTAYPGLEDLPEQKRLIPIQFGQETTDTGCPENLKDIFDGKTFKYEEDTKTGIKRVLLCTKKCSNVPKLTMIGFASSDPLLTDMQIFLRDIGLPADVIKNPDDVLRKLETKDYSLAFLPINMVSKDPYPYYGVKGRDLSQIRLNNNKSVLDAKVEDNLLKYSSSNLQDVESKNNLINFFKNEYVSVNLFRSKTEINYNKRVNNLEQSLPSFGEFLQTYYTAPVWYEKTKRQLK